MPETTTAPTLNADPDWDAFDSAAYAEHNYKELRGDDAEILGIVRDWFASTVQPGASLVGIDVGAGSNLYPALSLLPYCATVTLWEYSRQNVDWLRAALKRLPEEWRPFAELAGNDWESARDGLGLTCVPHRGSVFDLPERWWGIGTMFFCADSLTEDPDEFERAVGCFTSCLMPGAPFGIATMENSGGYEVAGAWFPAVPIVAPQLLDVLERLGATEVTVRRVDIDPVPIRAGYSGYLVATGRA